MSDIKSKRKRLANTSDEQYEEYLSMMENDYVFRSGIVNPTLGDDYVNKKWIELTTKLNSLGNGPILSMDIWKKRFNDWKNATRSKYRRIQEHRYKTGGGPEAVIKMTPIEERGLNVWGKVTVTGSCIVLATGGLVDPSTSGMNTLEECDINCTEQEMVPTCSPSIEILLPLEPEQLEPSKEHQQEEQSPVVHKTIYKKKTPLKPNTRSQRQNRPLNEVAESLLNIYSDNLNVSKELNKNLKRLGDLYQDCEEKKLKLESRRLEFDIAKYKFEKKNFEFN